MPASHLAAIVYAPYRTAEYDAVRLNRLAILDCATGRNAPGLVQELPGANAVAWTPDGTRLVIGRHTYGLNFAGTPTVAVFNADTLELESGWSWPDGSPYVDYLAVSNAHIAIVWSDGGEKVYDLATKSLVATLAGITSAVTDMAWSPDGAYLAVAEAGKLTVFESATWTVVSSAPSFAYPFPLAWSPDGAYLAIAQQSNGAVLRVFESATWTEILTGVTSTQWPISLSWSADGGRIGIGLEGAPHLLVVTAPAWVPQTVSMPTGVRTGGLTRISMLPDGRVLVARENPRRVSLVAADLQTVLYDLHASHAEVSSITLSPWLDNRISGIVLDESETPAAGRAVLAIHDATAAVVARTTTAADGSYTLSTPGADGHTVLLIEDDGRAQALGSGILPL